MIENLRKRYNIHAFHHSWYRSNHIVLVGHYFNAVPKWSTLLIVKHVWGNQKPGSIGKRILDFHHLTDFFENRRILWIVYILNDIAFPSVDHFFIYILYNKYLFSMAVRKCSIDPRLIDLFGHSLILNVWWKNSNTLKILHSVLYWMKSASKHW